MSAGFRVKGKLDSTPYEVEVTGDPKAPIVGSKKVRALLEQWKGRTVKFSPTGPFFTVQPDDPKSLLALLLTCTTVREVGEGAPQLAGVKVYGAVQ